MFRRTRRTQSYVRCVLASTEGCVTEPLYLYLLQRTLLENRIQFDLLFEKGKSDPGHVLRRMEERLDKTALRPGDEAWLVVDRDRWTDEQLRPLADWACASSPTIRRRLVVSNPNFELWLLLHFQSVSPDISAHEIAGRLGAFIPGYDKSVPSDLVTQERVAAAIARAVALNPPTSPEWPRAVGTTIHEAIADLLEPEVSRS